MSSSVALLERREVEAQEDLSAAMAEREARKVEDLIRGER
jgi:hypothetical protein